MRERVEKNYGACKSITFVVRSRLGGATDAVRFAVNTNMLAPPRVCSPTDTVLSIRHLFPPFDPFVPLPFFTATRWHPMAIKDQTAALVRPQPSSFTVTLVSRSPPAPPASGTLHILES